MGAPAKYTCNVCGKMDLREGILRKHLETDHHLGLEEYYWRFVNRSESPPTCFCGCGERVPFQGMAPGFNKYLNSSHKLKYQNRDPAFVRASSERMSALVRRLNEDSDYVAKRNSAASRNGMDVLKRLHAQEDFAKRHAERSSKRLKVQWSDSEFRDINNENRKKAAIKNSLYRKNNDGRGVYEDAVYKQLIKQGLQVISEDYRFFRARKGGYVLDLSIPDLKINIEIDGWAHNRSKERDNIRDAWLKDQGWAVIRLSNEDVRNDLESALASVYAAIRERQQTF